MQTNLCDSARQRAEAAEAERILRSCVHCGFCNAPARPTRSWATNSTARADGST